MRRPITWVGQQVYEWDLSAPSQYAMTALAKLCAAVFGTSGVANGLACTETSPASGGVYIGPGEIYQMEDLEATTCGTLPADTTDTILKQGIQFGTVTLAASLFPAPATSGESINYLIEAQYQDSDISLDPTSGASPVVLQYYNSANPSTPWSGPNNSGATSNTFRDGIVALNVVPGVAATTGSQVTPSPGAGWLGLWVVTVSYGQATITSANIAAYPSAPFASAGLLGSAPAFLFSPTAPTPAPSDNSTKLATTSFVQLLSGATSLTGSGYRKFPAYPGDPNPLILQWGVASLANAQNATVTLPIAFPNQALRGYASDAGSTTVYAWGANFPSLSQIKLWCSATPTSAACQWWAIGN